MNSQSEIVSIIDYMAIFGALLISWAVKGVRVIYNL